MTFTHAIFVFSIAISFGAGYYVHYRFGATVAKDAQVVKTAVQDIKKL